MQILISEGIKKILPAAADYFETRHFVFVHGWLPAYTVYPDTAPEEAALRCRPDWRDATYKEWCAARWHNGMERCCLDRYGIPDKTVVCGHWHTSFGHARISKKGSEYGADACFAPFRAEGILALDACTARSGLVNCVVLED